MVCFLLPILVVVVVVVVVMMMHNCGYHAYCSNDQSIFLTQSEDGGLTWSTHTVIASADYAVWG